MRFALHVQVMVTMSGQKLLLVLLLISPSALAMAAATEAVDCAAMLHRRCEVCHYNSRYCQKLGQKSQRAWKRSIKTMVAYGAKLTTEEQQQVAECLASPTPAVQDYCKAP